MTKKTKLTREDIFKRVASGLHKALTEGDTVESWQKPWQAISKGYCPRTRPVNVDGRQYAGCNVALLAFSAMDLGYDLTLPFGTFKAWKTKGASVTKGEHGLPIFFWKVYEVEEKDDATGEVKLSKRFCPRMFTVFHASQVTDFDADAWREKHGRPAPSTGEEIVEPTGPELPEVLEAFEAHATETLGAVIDWRAGDRAYYQNGVGVDRVVMPTKSQFRSTEGLAQTLAHELTHWTGGPARLNRVFGKRFGDSAYRAEEIVAEGGAAMICGALGIIPGQADGHIDAQHVAYCRSWLRKLSEEKACEVLVDGLAKAHKAAHYLTEGFIEEAVN